MKNELFTEQIISLEEFQNNVVPSILAKAKGRKVMILSDFDETLCSLYSYSPEWQTHVPILSRDWKNICAMHAFDLVVATARGAQEPVSKIIVESFGQYFPVVCENGGALLDHDTNEVNKYDAISLLTPDELNLMECVKAKMEIQELESHIPSSHSIALREDRIATIELRAQDRVTKKGTPHDYELLRPFLELQLIEFLDKISIIPSGSSLGIQPKRINKAFGIIAALKMKGIEYSDTFVVGLGDNKNDHSLFRLAKHLRGISIGVRPGAIGISDVCVDGGEDATWSLLSKLAYTKYIE